MTLTDYSDLEKEITESEQPKILPRGSEAQLRIILVREGSSDKYDGARWYQPVFEVVDQPLVMEFNDFFWDLLDRDKLTPKMAARALGDFKIFAKAFGLDYSQPFSWTDDLIGLTGWAILGVKKDDEYGDKNTVSKYIAGK